MINNKFNTPKRSLILLLLLLISTMLFSDFLEIIKLDGTNELINIEDIENITFSDGSGLYSIPELIEVPAGSFNMGQVGLVGAEPVHQVTLTNNYSMGKYEITNQNFCDMLNLALDIGELSGDYENNVTVNNSNGQSAQLMDLDGVSASGDRYCEISYADGCFVVDDGRENRPVNYMTWYGAAFYTNMLSICAELTPLYDLSDWSCNTYPDDVSGFRLPTEAEWEYAARYNDERIYPWGNDAPTANHANYDYDFNGGVDEKTDVGSYSPFGDSQLGFCDLTGNVWEMTNDWVGDHSSEDQTNPLGPDSNYQNHRIRKGSDFAAWDIALPAAFRSNYHVLLPLIGTGFRVVKIGD